MWELLLNPSRLQKKCNKLVAIPKVSFEQQKQKRLIIKPLH